MALNAILTRMFNNLHFPQFSMHCAWLLYKLHVNNGDIEKGSDSRQAPSTFPRADIGIYLTEQIFLAHILTIDIYLTEFTSFSHKSEETFDQDINNLN